MDDALLHEPVLPIQDPTGDLVLPVVVVGPQRPEAPADAAPEVAAEEVGKLHGFPPALHPGPAQGMGARQCGGHGEEIRTDFHAPEEERLLLLEVAAEPVDLADLGELLVLEVIDDLDDPFTGVWGVSSEPFERIRFGSV